MKNSILFALILIFFTACSGKKYFEPENPRKDFHAQTKGINSSIRSMNRLGATLKDGRIITHQGVSEFKLPKGFDFLNISSDGKIIATNNLDKLMIGDEQIEVENPVVAASLKGDLLALVYSNNTVELKNLITSKSLYKEYLPLALANDTRITNPHFMGNLILFPTLNGKVIIISAKTFESVKNIAVDPDGEFKNIIFLGVIDKLQTLIVASPNKIVSISPEQILAKDYELRDILVKDDYVYIATIDGSIIKLTPNLEQIAKTKFKYAKILSLSYSDNNIYALESQGYILKIADDFSSEDIYKFSFDDEKKLIPLANKIYYDTEELILP